MCVVFLTLDLTVHVPLQIPCRFPSRTCMLTDLATPAIPSAIVEPGVIRALFRPKIRNISAALMKTVSTTFWGSFRCAGLLDGGEEEALSGGASAAQGCSMEGKRRLFLGELPLRGAVRWREGGGSFRGSFRCAGLFGGGEEEALSGGAAAARGCSVEGRRRLFLGELPLRGAVRWRGGGGSFRGSCRCAGLLDRG